MKMQRFKKLLSLLLSVSVLAAGTVPAQALEDTDDTIWGSVPASAYIAYQFYETQSNTVTVPLSYFHDIAEGRSLKDTVTAVMRESQRQSCYLFGDRGSAVSYGDNDTLVITRNSYFDLETELMMRRVVENEANRIIDSIISPHMSDYEKAVAIYNYVRLNSEYDWDAYHAIVSDDCFGNIDKWAKSVTAYGSLITGKSVCQGDAQAFNLLARKAGLISIMATGTFENEKSGHAWNRVWANGRWYEVDACYDIFCSTFQEYQTLTGVEYGGVGIIESSRDDFYST